MAQLIKSSLRMRPDRLIIGEVRGAEVADMLQAMNTGHCGMSTGHGNSVRGMLRRLESMYLMAAPVDIESVRGQIAEGIDIMVHIEKFSGSSRRIVEITEIEGYERGEFILNVLMMQDEEGKLTATGNKLRSCRKIYSGSEENAALLRKYGFI